MILANSLAHILASRTRRSLTYLKNSTMNFSFSKIHRSIRENFSMHLGQPQTIWLPSNQAQPIASSDDSRYLSGCSTALALNSSYSSDSCVNQVIPQQQSIAGDWCLQIMSANLSSIKLLDSGMQLCDYLNIELRTTKDDQGKWKIHRRIINNPKSDNSIIHHRHSNILHISINI